MNYPVFMECQVILVLKLFYKINAILIFFCYNNQEDSKILDLFVLLLLISESNLSVTQTDSAAMSEICQIFKYLSMCVTDSLRLIL